jgi:hypothetical protein
LFGLGFGVIGLVTIVSSLLFGVVQWAASSFSPRLNLFSEDPLVWRTSAITIGVFVYSVSAGLGIGDAGRVSVLVRATAVVAALIAFALIRALQTRAFVSLQLSQVLAGSGRPRPRRDRDDVYSLPFAVGCGVPSPFAHLRPFAAQWTGLGHPEWCISLTCDGSWTRLSTTTPWSCFG